jgi:hypothetical protein
VELESHPEAHNRSRRCLSAPSPRYPAANSGWILKEIPNFWKTEPLRSSRSRQTNPSMKPLCPG